MSAKDDIDQLLKASTSYLEFAADLERQYGPEGVPTADVIASWASTIKGNTIGIYNKNTDIETPDAPPVTIPSPNQYPDVPGFEGNTLKGMMSFQDPPSHHYQTRDMGGLTGGKALLVGFLASIPQGKSGTLSFNTASNANSTGHEVKVSLSPDGSNPVKTVKGIEINIPWTINDSQFYYCVVTNPGIPKSYPCDLAFHAPAT
jgi:hypothetical protein